MWRSALPAAITSLRLILLPHLIMTWVRGETGTALLLYGLALASDFLDGWVARHLGTRTRVGAWFDSIADIVFVETMLFVLAFRGILPLWSPALPTLAAIVFLWTSTWDVRFGRIGKFFGGALYGVVGLALAGISVGLRLVLAYGAAVLSLVVVSERFTVGFTGTGAPER